MTWTRPDALSLLVPTLGRPELRRCIESALPQMRDGDELIVVGDTFEAPPPDPRQGDWRLTEVAALCDEYGFRVFYAEHDAGKHDWGHSQLNRALDLAHGSWIHCNDDDDIWAPGALDAMRAAIARLDAPRPILFRFRSRFGVVFWLEEGGVSVGRIGGHCLLAPNAPARLGRFTARYEGDFDWIESTLSHYPEGPVWDPTIVCIARPS